MAIHWSMCILTGAKSLTKTGPSSFSQKPSPAKSPQLVLRLHELLLHLCRISDYLDLMRALERTGPFHSCIHGDIFTSMETHKHSSLLTTSEEYYVLQSSETQLPNPGIFLLTPLTALWPWSTLNAKQFWKNRNTVFRKPLLKEVWQRPEQRVKYGICPLTVRSNSLERQFVLLPKNHTKIAKPVMHMTTACLCFPPLWY